MARTKRKKQNGDDVRRLTGRWVFEMAYLLIDESEAPMERSEAMRQAHLVRRLLEQLGEGEVTFEYCRSDGSLRRARGTLARGLSEAFDRYVRKLPLKPAVHDDGLHFTYWDLDKEAFRSFAVARVKRIISTDHEQ